MQDHEIILNSRVKLSVFYNKGDDEHARCRKCKQFTDDGRRVITIGPLCLLLDFATQLKNDARKMSKLAEIKRDSVINQQNF